jgi:hexosaminidase
MFLSRRSAVPLGAALAFACTTFVPRSAHSQQPASPMMPPLASLSAHRVIPVPSSVTAGTGASFTFDSTTTIVVPAGGGQAAQVGQALATLLRPSMGIRLPVSVSNARAARGAIVLRLDGPAALGNEGYAIDVSADSLRLTASKPAGLFYAMQTLRQLLPAGVEAHQSLLRLSSSWSVPPGRIEDRPRFAYRGAMLDVARHFFTVDEVKQYIDMIALYKINILHLHLSDDQGWRIQIDSWPKLTTIGGSTEVAGGPGGFYTKADYADIVRYAQERAITIVPEIDLPGHTNAAIAAYPQLGCSRPMPSPYGGTQPPGLYTGIRVGWSTVCHDREVTYRFVNDVVRELAAMTPGPYIHIGGDEVEALTHEQYARFIERTQDIVYRHGKTMVGWEEVAKARLRPTSIAQQWKSDSAMAAIRQGAKLIVSPAQKTYLDMKYTPETELGLRWAAIIELRTAYDWDPVTYNPGSTEQSIVGVEAPLWSETIRNLSSAQFLAMPRLPAIAEVGWSAASSKDWESFRTRIAAHAPRWRLLGINYYQSPQVTWSPPLP